MEKVERLTTQVKVVQGLNKNKGKGVVGK